MNENELCGVSVVSFPISGAFSVPISNLSSLLSATCDTYVIIGTHDQIHFQDLPDSVHLSAFPYQFGSSIIKQVFRYNILQFKIIFKLLSLRENIQSVVFFMEFPPILPMVIMKISGNKVYWLLPSKISLLSEDIFSKFTTILSKICYNLCDVIILYSSSLGSDWHLTPYRHKILIAHEHFLDFNTFTVTTPFPDRPPLIGYIGRLSAEKGVQHFVQALPAILKDQPDLQILIGGDGQLKESITTSLEAENITSRVELPGWISHDDLPKYLNQLRLLVLPSYTEGLPNIMLEAMACGTPVLATPVGAIPDVIRDRETGFILKDNTPECIDETVNRVLTSDLERVSVNGRRLVEENFNFERTIEQWRLILDAI